MKYLVFILVLIATSCAPPPSSIPEQLLATGFDFSTYSKKGFLFTPDTYMGDYESIGIVSLTYTPSAKLTERSEHYRGSVPEVEKSEWVIDSVDPDRAVAEMYRICIEMGADALTQLDIEPYSTSHGELSTKPVTITGLKINGFAIKRLGAFK